MNTARSGARLDIQALHVPQDENADFSSDSIDLSVYEGVVVILAFARSVSGTTPTLALRLHDSADDSSFALTEAKATNGDSFGLNNPDGAGSQTVFRVDVAKFGNRKFLKLNGDLGGETPVYTVGAYVMGQKKYPG